MAFHFCIRSPLAPTTASCCFAPMIYSANGDFTRPTPLLPTSAKHGMQELSFIGGQVIRPSQDCSVRYGYALGFQAITKLNTCEYAETSIRTLLPPESENICGIHSYARGGGFEMIDGKDIRRL
jgi:hypothetical protein